VPTFAWLARFGTDFDRLTAAQKAAFLTAVAQFVEDLRTGGELRQGLRVKGVRGAPGVFEMTWADDGRATFQFGEPAVEGEPHIVWRRIGSRHLQPAVSARVRTGPRATATPLLRPPLMTCGRTLAWRAGAKVARGPARRSASPPNGLVHHWQQWAYRVAVGSG